MTRKNGFLRWATSVRTTREPLSLPAVNGKETRRQPFVRSWTYEISPVENNEAKDPFYRLGIAKARAEASAKCVRPRRVDGTNFVAFFLKSFDG
ncbi:MAG: hypothetical protein ACREIF_14740 [Chthoniobacterales bacterium]